MKRGIVKNRKLPAWLLAIPFLSMLTSQRIVEVLTIERIYYFLVVAWLLGFMLMAHSEYIRWCSSKNRFRLYGLTILAIISLAPFIVKKNILIDILLFFLFFSGVAAAVIADRLEKDQTGWATQTKMYKIDVTFGLFLIGLATPLMTHWFIAPVTGSWLH
ncbi:MAG TPA: hypothetical protein ENI11_04250 [Actinobacteria bacterium]|nr:hypothetical protein [Actinomycetota bacterium]